MNETQELANMILDPAVADNPLAFVMSVFPWGVKGSPLEKIEGPRRWQKEELLQIAEHIANNKELERKGDVPLIYRSVTASGRGVGKSSLSSWLIWWMLSTKLGSTTIVSANSESQLKSKTMAEFGKWKTLAINNDWFDQGAMKVTPKRWLEEALKKDFQYDSTYYYAEAALWNADNPNAYAGAHNPLGLLLLFDEASGIPDNIWQVAEGFFTEKSLYRLWIGFSNPRSNKGAFYDCFNAHADYWHTRNLDARTVEESDTFALDQIVRKYGEHSDEARIEVLGQFPQTGDNQFIGMGAIKEAAGRNPQDLFDREEGLIMGVDPARFGEDKSVICFRQGRTNAKGWVPDTEQYSKVDNMFLADRIAYLIDTHRPDAVCIDAGNGGGIIDRLRQRKYKVNEVWFGGKATDSDAYGNKRIELWAKMRDWIEGAALDTNSDLHLQLCTPNYKFIGNSDRKVLESKEDMKRRGVKESPDYADALACTFAITVARKDLYGRFKQRGERVRIAEGTDSNVF